MGQSRVARLFLILGVACWPSVVQAGQAYNPFTGRTDLCVTVQEVDASPSNGGCGTLTVTNGSLTDNGDGTYALAVPSTSDLVLTDTSPSLQFCDSSDNTAYLFHADTAAVYPFALYQGTCASGVFAVAPSRPLLAFDTSRRLILMDQFNGGGTQCLQVNNQGLVTGTGSACGGGGGGSGTVTSITAGTGLTGGTITTSGTIALSTPVTVANGGTGLTSGTSGGVPGYTATGTLASSAALTANALLLGGGAGATPTSLGAATNGQLPIGSTSATPVLATLTGVANETDVTNGAGTITIGLVDPLIVGKGGTGAASYTSNGVLYGQGTSALAVTAQGGTNTVLTANAGAPSFSNSPALTAVSVTNNVQWLPATGTQFETYASGSQWFLTDLTLGNVILRYNGSSNVMFPSQTWDFSGATMRNATAGNVQTFTASGSATWSKPSGVQTVCVSLWGGGGGGGGGNGAASGVSRVGGGGGGGGAFTARCFSATDLGATESVSVGAAGTAGAGGSSGAGTAGGAGGTSTFGTTTLVRAFGGGGGRGAVTASTSGGGGGGGTGSAGAVGTSAGGKGGDPGNAATLSAIGGQGAAGGATQGTNTGGNAEYGGGGGGANPNGAGNAGGSSISGLPGGGAGGGVTSANAAQAAAAGGNINNNVTGGGGAAGTSGATCTNGTAGANGNSALGGTGGGGGGGDTDSAGCAGGNSGVPGGGGGGGGGGTSTGGDGGVGGSGQVIVYSW